MTNSNSITFPRGTNVPDHIALLPDGDRRWARSRNLDVTEGHKAGYLAIKKTIDASRAMGVHTFTIWGFSTENWERSEKERENIMNLIRRMIKDFTVEAEKENVRFVHLGRKDRLPKDIVKLLSETELRTKKNTSYVLNVALDYGGRDEIVRAVKRVVQAGVKAEKISEELLSHYLDTGDQPYPYPDLFIRTSGEQRDSGLMPWQMTYTEYYWEQDNLPDMTPQRLREIILDYSRRRRRFGANDSEEHLQFDPKVVADLDIKWRHALALNQGERLRDLAVRYVKEHYGLSKELAKTAGFNMARALIYGEEKNWLEAKKALEALYEVVQKTLKLAFEPKVIASIEVDLWRDGQDEESLKNLLAEKFRVSTFQVAKSAHLAYLANREVNLENWSKARDYMEKFYQALKERVA